ncbi:MAG: ABC transporter substrate-binding protein [Candidatus Gracilibacteria bacterium]
MKIFRKLGKVFRSYSDLDKAISFACLGVIILMFLKMIIFPYGLFNFGKVDIYTEGLVGPNGFQNLNPLFVDYNILDREVSRLVFSGLMKYDTETGAIVGDMADLTINEEKTEYTFVLKDGLKWHDGVDLTTEDVYYTFAEVVQDPTFANEILKVNFDGVQIEVIDEKTIKFKLEKPNIFFITSLTTGLLPKHILEGVPVMDLLQNEFNKEPIGSGPYEVSEPIQVFKDGRMQVTLEANRYYYGVNPKLEHFRFISYSTEDQLMEQLNAVNGIVKISGEYADKVKKTGEFVMIPYELPQYMAVFVNMDSPEVQDELIRIALEKSIYKDELMAKLSDKKLVNTPLLELGKADEWIYQPSIDNANGAIYEAGYEYASLDSRYRTDDDGQTLHLSLIARQFPEGSQQAGETKVVVSYLEHQWEAIGMEIDVELLPVDKLNERIMDRSYDLLFIGQTLGYNLDAYSYWHSTQIGANGLNLSNYKSFQVDSLIEDVRSVFDPVKREEKLKLIAEKIAEDIPAIFLYKPVYYYASDGKVEGIKMDNVAFPSDRFSNILDWHFVIYDVEESEI